MMIIIRQISIKDIHIPKWVVVSGRVARKLQLLLYYITYFYEMDFINFLMKMWTY